VIIPTLRDKMRRYLLSRAFACQLPVTAQVVTAQARKSAFAMKFTRDE